jgi:hypothetical protein
LSEEKSSTARLTFPTFARQSAVRDFVFAATSRFATIAARILRIATVTNKSVSVKARHFGQVLMATSPAMACPTAQKDWWRPRS